MIVYFYVDREKHGRRCHQSPENMVTMGRNEGRIPSSFKRGLGFLLKKRKFCYTNLAKSPRVTAKIPIKIVVNKVASIHETDTTGTRLLIQKYDSSFNTPDDACGLIQFNVKDRLQNCILSEFAGLSGE